jgi:hypothetical protein
MAPMAMAASNACDQADNGFPRHIGQPLAAARVPHKLSPIQLHLDRDPKTEGRQIAPPPPLVLRE